MSTESEKKLILVIGATGAQGLHVIPKLLAPCDDGSPSPYRVRALTRDPENRRAKELEKMGCEIFKGQFDVIEDIVAAYKGCYGVFVNTDTYTVGMEKEIFWSVKLWEYAQREPSMRHFIYSGLDYCSKLGNWDLQYKAEHYDGKGIFGEYLRAQECPSSGPGVSWTNIVTGVYMDMLFYPLIGPLNVRPDGTVVFAHAIGDGHAPMIALDDLGWWTRYTLDNRDKSAGQVFEITSDMVTWDQLSEAFTRATGIPSVHKRLTMSEWINCMTDTTRPIANQKQKGDGSTTIASSFSGMMSIYRDDIVKRDMDWLRSVHPGMMSIETWIRENNFKGIIGSTALKNSEDGKARLIPNREVCDQL